MELPDLKPKQNATNKIDIWSRTIVALALGILLGALLSLTGINNLSNHVPSLLRGFVIIITILAVLAFFIVQYKEKVLKTLFGVDNTELSEVKEMGQSLFLNSWNRDFAKAKTDFDALFTKVFAWYSWMSFRRWIVLIFNTLFISFGGLLGTVLIHNQNKLLQQQNAMLERQSTRLDQQTYLQEADRRSSLIFLMGNLLDAMDKELKSDIGQVGVRDLSPQLIGRIIALSKSLRPYRYLDKDSLVARELSPERGQLLLSIVASQVDNTSIRRILQAADFSYSDMKGAVLSGEYLEGINLFSSDLTGALLDETNLNNANLSNSDLSGAIFARAKLQNARLREANLKSSYFDSADLRNANLYKAQLQGAKLNGAYLQNTHLSQTNLTKADLSAAVISQTNFENAILDSAIVLEINWLEKHGATQRDSVLGAKQLNASYRIDSVLTGFGYQFMLLKKSLKQHN
jgi:uncharacterized protein YjbI with pentapeptide repeats